jgi:hypothetical protein
MRVILTIFSRLARPTIQPVVQLCLCQSYSVLTVCITGSLQNQANPFFSLAIPNHAHIGLRLYCLPRQVHLKGILLCANKVLYKRHYEGQCSPKWPKQPIKRPLNGKQ